MQKILILDDNIDIRYVLSQVINLEIDEVEVEEAATYEEALDLLKKNVFDIIISDIHLGDMSGIDLVTLAHKIDSSIEFIIITGKNNIIEDFYKSRLNNISSDKFMFFQKPFENDEIIFSIRKSLKKLELEKQNAILMEKIQKLAEVGELVNEVTHDLKGFIGSMQMIANDGIKFMIENMSIEEVKTDIIQSCDDIFEAGKTSLEFIESILSINRMDQNVGLTDVSALIKKALVPIKTTLAKHSVICDFNEPEGEILAHASNQIIRVIMNLVKNAMEILSKKKGALIDISVEENEENVFICIKDNGSGIPKSVLTKLQKGTKISTKGQDGNGLGIVGAHKILKSIGGKLLIESTENVGSIFKLQLNKSNDA